MAALLQQSYAPVLAMGIVLAVILFAIGSIRKFTRLAIGIIIISVLASILFTTFWGNGISYISKITSCLTPNQQQRIEEAYAHYKKRDANINFGAVSGKITDVFSSVQGRETEAMQETVRCVEEKAKEWLRQPPSLKVAPES